MQIIYDKYKNKEITYQDGTVGIVCGFVQNNLLLATKEKPEYSFRRFDKGFHFVEEKYKGEEYRYCYCNESTVEKQHPIK